MRQLSIAALALLLAVTLACRKKQTSATAGVDTVQTPTTPAPPTADTAPAVRPFGFDQRQEFAQSIRQQLAGIDQQIKDLSAQAKSRGGAVSDRALGEVRASRRSVDRTLSRINAATAANWEQVKQAVNQSVDRLTESIQAAQPK